MSGNIGHYKRGHVAIATPEHVAELEQNIRLALEEIERHFNKDVLAELEEVDVLPSLRRALRVIVPGLFGQLDAAHSYEFSSLHLGPMFAWEIEGRDDAETAQREPVAAAEYARRLGISPAAVRDAVQRCDTVAGESE